MRPIEESEETPGRRPDPREHPEFVVYLCVEGRDADPRDAKNNALLDAVAPLGETLVQKLQELAPEGATVRPLTPDESVGVSDALNGRYYVPPGNYAPYSYSASRIVTADQEG